MGKWQEGMRGAGMGSAIVEVMLVLVGRPSESVDFEGFDRPGEARTSSRRLGSGPIDVSVTI